MRKIALGLLVALLLILPAGLPPAHAGMTQAPPAEVASYTIDAAYDPLTRRITGSQTLTYRNVTETAIPDLVFHLYLNAFSSEDTLWMQEAGPGHRGYGYDPSAPGWIRVEEVRLSDGATLSLVPVDEDETLVRADLPDPVAPGGEVTAEMRFTAQLPRAFARTGWGDGGDFVMAGQWFPKLGVWEEGAWNAHVFHANSEFYADFGTYEVAVTLPAGWEIGATGTRQGDPEGITGGAVTHRFRAEHVIDFAWSASPHFEVLERTTGGVRVEVLHYGERRALADRVMEATLEGLALYGDWYGPYGAGLYPEVTVILVPEDAGGAGGMEYPTLFTVGVLAMPLMPDCVRFIEAETVHELAHQWFQSVIATNEPEAPWLDEGFAEYSTVRAMRELSRGDVVSCAGWTMSYLYTDRSSYKMTPNTPMSGAAWELEHYGVAAYAKPAVSLSTLERLIGEEAMLEFLGTYTERYAFAHPDEEDVRAVMAETLGQSIADWFFDDLVDGTGTLDARIVELRSDAVTVEREGELCVPVPVALVDPDGVEMPVWSCEEAFDPDTEALIAAHIDPDLTALLDLNLTNNGLRRQVDEGGWLRATAWVLQALQTLFRGGGLW